MERFPVLGTKETVNYGMVLNHEKQAMKNHGGQTVEQLAKRGGLTWSELYYVLKDLPFNKTLPNTVARNFVEYDNDWYERNIENSKDFEVFPADQNAKIETLGSGLRPCVIKSPANKSEVEMKAYFHRWVDKSDVYEPSPLIGGHPGGTIRYIMALVEYEDGSMGEWPPNNIQFTDRSDAK